MSDERWETVAAHVEACPLLPSIVPNRGWQAGSGSSHRIQAMRLLEPHGLVLGTLKTRRLLQESSLPDAEPTQP